MVYFHGHPHKTNTLKKISFIMAENGLYHILYIQGCVCLQHMSYKSTAPIHLYTSHLIKFGQWAI